MEVQGISSLVICYTTRSDTELTLALDVRIPLIVTICLALSRRCGCKSGNCLNIGKTAIHLREQSRCAGSGLVRGRARECFLKCINHQFIGI
jgi:hypothetical protein